MILTTPTSQQRLDTYISHLIQFWWPKQRLKSRTPYPFHLQEWLNEKLQVRDSQRKPVGNIDYNFYCSTGLWLRLSRGQKEFLFFFFLRFPFDSSNLKNSNQAAILNNHHLLSPVLVRGQSSNGQTSEFLDNIGYWAVVSITHSPLNDPCQYTNNANQKIIQKSLFNLSILIYAYRIPTCLMILDFKTYPN